MRPTTRLWPLSMSESYGGPGSSPDRAAQILGSDRTRAVRAGKRAVRRDVPVCRWSSNSGRWVTCLANC